jgi:hypothetical protein
MTIREKFWSVVHNCLAHPLMEILPEKVGARIHDWSASKAYPEVETEETLSLQRLILALKIRRVYLEGTRPDLSNELAFTIACLEDLALLRAPRYRSPRDLN